MVLAIFDLDNTLLGGDSDYLWGKFLVEQGLVNEKYYRQENQRFYKNYQAGTLDIHAFLAFSLKPLSQHDLDTLRALHQQFMAEKIEPILLPKAQQLIEQHRAQNDRLLIITATNRFITQPIAQRLGVNDLIATEPEIRNDRFTGYPTGIPCFQGGKVTRLNAWLDTNQQGLAGSWFYTDSHNDIPLLEIVTHPIAVDPDEPLRHHAQEKNWDIISLRG